MIVLRYSQTTLQANCYILADDEARQALVVDPGAGAAPWVRSALEAHGLSLAGVLLTHAHADHCWDAPEIAGSTVPVYVPQPDMYRMDDPAEYTGFSPEPFEHESGRAWVRPNVVEEVPASLFVGGGAQLVEGVALRAVPTPGHTEGMTVYLFGGQMTDDEQAPDVPAEAGQYLLTGDLLFAGSVGRTDLPGGNEREMMESLRLISQVIAPGTPILPGHGAPSSMGEEIAQNLYLRQALGQQ